MIHRNVLPVAALVAGAVLISTGFALATAPRSLPSNAPDDSATNQARRTPWDLKAPALHPDGRPEVLDCWKDLSCARCHAQITAEWAASAHAIAWVSEPFQEQTADMKRPESCHGCHAPLPLIPAAKDGALPQKPAPRDVSPKVAAERELDAHFGVTCASCHEGPGGSVLGPFEVSTPAHTSVQDPRFTADSSDDLCIACHATNVGPVLGIAKDFVDKEQASKGLGCVACHMQAVERPIAAEEGKPPYATRAGRSHALQSPRDPEFLSRAFRFEAKHVDGATIVTVHNECGHRVPGLIGREIVLAVTLVGDDAVPAAKLTIDRKTQLAVDDSLEIRVAGVGARVRVTGTHLAPGFEAPVGFVDVTVDVAR